MIRKLSPLFACLFLCACASADPSDAPKVALDCGDAPTGSHLARRNSCVPRTEESREEARKQADAMRDEMRRSSGVTKGP